MSEIVDESNNRSYWVATTTVHEILTLPFVWIDGLVHGPAVYHYY